MSRTAKTRDLRTRRIKAVEPGEGDYVLRVTWEDGSTERVDLTEPIFRLKYFRPLRNKRRFGNVTVADWGWAISWGEELDFSAEALARLADEQANAEMTPGEFRAWLKKHGLTQQAAADLLGVSKRTIAYYSTGAQPVTRTVALAVKGAESKLNRRFRIDRSPLVSAKRRETQRSGRQSRSAESLTPSNTSRTVVRAEGARVKQASSTTRNLSVIPPQVPPRAGSYVQLNRTFEEFADTEDYDEAVAASLRRGILDQEMGWPELLTHRFVIVLGEAGTGKTTEFREQARTLANGGKAAFFIPIEDLCDRRLEPDLEACLKQWKTNDDDGVFLLDSVDEARLDHPAAFRRALNELVRVLGRSSGIRARIVVSCRVSDWQYRADLATMLESLRPLIPLRVEESEAAYSRDLPQQESGVPELGTRFPPPHADERPQADVNLVRLAPLNDIQIARLASAWGVDDVERFMTALKEGDLEIFAARPRDLEWLVTYWNEHGSFGSLAEMVELNVRHKLEERNPSRIQRDEPLSAVDAREDVESLAAATVLCERPMIALPDPEIERDLPPRSLWPRDVLPNRTDKEIQALLTRGVFDPATLGRIRFHDQMVRDYLAAGWMVNKVARGQRRARVHDLVLRESFGVTRPVPSKRMVLGWLAAKVPEIRREIITNAPDVLLYCGDARQVPVEERGQALRALAGTLRNTGRTDWLVYDSDVRRIVDPQLSPIVRELLETEVESYEITHLLLRMVKLGRLTECADCALAIALNEGRDETGRTEAARAIASAGSAEQKATLLQYAREKEGLSNRLLGAICGALFPGVIGVPECLELARRGTSESAGIDAGLGRSFAYDIVERCPPFEMGALLEGLLELTRQGPLLRLRNENVVSQRFAWTLVPLAALLTRLLKELPEHDYPIDGIVEAYLLLDRCRDHPTLFIPGKERLEKELATHLATHRPVYWGVVRARLCGAPESRWSAWRLSNEMLALSKQDFPWLLEDIACLTNAAELAFASETALNIWYMASRPEEEAQAIVEAVEKSSASNDLKRHVRESIWPPPRKETPREKEIRERRSKREQAERAVLTESRKKFENRIEKIRSGEDLSALLYFHEQMRRSKTATNSTWAQTDWQALIPDFGTKLSDAARKGFKTYWKNWTPPHPFERAGDNTVENGVLVGLTGLAITAQDGADFQRLSPEEAETAAHYALRELNGFPNWFEDLANTHPAVVRSVFSRQLAAELTAETDAPDPGDVLSSVRYGPAVVRELCADFILDQLAAGDPPRVKALDEALEVLIMTDNVDRARLSDIAADRAVAHASASSEEPLLLWLTGWLWIDGTAAWRFVETFVAKRKEVPSPLVFSLAASFGDRLWGDRGIEEADFLRPVVLEQMIRAVYAHVRPADDPEHEVVYSIGTRETAQQFRDWLPRYLAQLPGKEAQDALQNLAVDLEPASERRWITNLVEQQAAKAVEYAAWHPRDVAAFGSVHDKAPTSPQELFEIAKDRLNDIKEDIERGDFSDRGLFQPGMWERLIQRWLAARLERESRGRYSIVREEEVDRREETDIRLHSRAAGIVTIEVKPVDRTTGRYSFNKLMGALEGQLVGQYLRASNSRHGVLVIAMLEKRQWDPRDGGGKISFPELIDCLNAKAPTIEASDNRVDGLYVIGIDFT